MLKIFGNRHRTKEFCDGVSRRDFIRVGGLALGGLTLPQLLAAEADAGLGRSHKAVIMIFMTGGPPHQDMYEIKTNAPSEIRGPFEPIATSVPGVQICEQLPRIAANMDKFAAIRSMVGSEGRHSQFQCTTGRTHARQPLGGWPSFGSAVAKVQRNVNDGVPPFTSLWYKWNEPNPGSGFLGPACAPFEPKGGAAKDMVLDGITLDRLDDRKNLLASMDRFRRQADASGAMSGADAFTQQAFGVLTSSRLVDALDLSKEDANTVERYGSGDDTKRLPSVPQNFLIARRLVEAGARVVMLNHDVWDWHGKNFQNAEKKFPVFECALTALVDDLDQRDMLRDVTVIAWGEFGRTPKINRGAGRDHWPRVSCALLAGGGMRTGQAIGATDRLGGEAAERPVTFQEVYATLYHNLGINVNTTTINNLNGRPLYLVQPGVQPIRELV